MTRIFGYEQTSPTEAHIDKSAMTVIQNLQEALVKTYQKGWQAYGLGFITVSESGAQGFSIFRNYRGINPNDNIVDLLP